MIQERHPSFQRDRHGHFVGEHQKLLRQGGLEIEVHDLIEHIRGVAFVEILLVEIGHIAAVQRQLLAEIILEHRGVFAVLLLQRHAGGVEIGLGQTEVVEHAAVTVDRHAVEYVAHHMLAEPQGHQAHIFVHLHIEIATVAPEQLIASHAGEDHRDGFPGQLGDQVGDQEGRVGQGLVEPGDQFGEEIDHVRHHQDLVVVGLVIAGKAPRRFQLVVGVKPFPKTDAVSADLLRAQLAHQVHDPAGIHPSAQEGAQRHVGHQAVFDRAFEGFVEAVGDLIFTAGELVLVRNLPITLQLHIPAFQAQEVGRGDLVNVLEHGIRRRGKAVFQKGGDALHIQFAANAGQGQDRFDLRGEDDLFRITVIIERFDPDAVARYQQGLLIFIPDSKAEHAVELLETVQPVFLVEMQHHFRVGFGGKLVPLLQQCRTVVDKIVDLAVEHDYLAFVRGEDRLMPAAQVDDAQAAHPQTDVLLHEKAFVIGPAMGHGVGHQPQIAFLHRFIFIEIIYADNTAHGCLYSLIHPVKMFLPQRHRDH